MTIKDLASLSGYSLGTVSRVLNGHPNVSEKAREKVLAIAREQGFSLNRNAKNLKQTRSNSLLVVVRGAQNELFAMLAERLQGLAAGGPYQLVMDYIDEMADEVAEAVRRVREIKPRGVMFLGASSEHFSARFEEIGVPAVLVTNPAGELALPNLSSVTTDDKAAARAVIELLLDRGHRSIAVIGGERVQSDTSRLRYAGCLRAFRDRGMAFDPDRYYRTARFSFESGYEAMASLLRDCPEVTAVFAMADVMAIGAARAAADAGRSIPEDLSLVGFDGLPICRYYSPRLATVRQDTDTMAEESYAILMDAIQNGQGPVHRLVSYQLEENDSVRDRCRDGKQGRCDL